MKNGVRIIDSDMHVIEPPQMWEKYTGTPITRRHPRSSWPLPLDDESKRKILWDNCARLYGIER